MAGASAVFIGDGSLLIRCAQAWRGRGHEIRAVLSQDPGILDWARAEGIAAVAIDDAAPPKAPRERFDYLFSIANLRVLPPAFLQAVGRLAVNFHDGPLPRYAGLHAPSWALLAREPAHGVTWHEMTAQVDSGRIVRQALFPIEPDDTAFSLNARCYEAGLATFQAMADDIGRGELRLSAQDAAGRSYFARDRRPPALATLDFSQSAAQVAALVRALDFGPYANPLGQPKLWAGPAVLYVRTARLLRSAPAAAPGTVIAIEGDEAHVATATGGLALGGITDAKQQSALHLLTPGMVLPALDNALREQLDACAPRVARGESSWRAAFGSLSPVALPYPRLASGAPAAPLLRVKLKAAGNGSSTAAGFFAWLSALTGQEQVSALYCDDALAAQADGLQAWLSPWVPLTLQAGAQSTSRDAAAQAEARIAQARDAGPWPHDLPSRAGADLRVLEGVAKVALGPATVTPPAGVELMLAHDASGRALELVVDAQAFSAETAQLMASHLQAWLEAFGQARGPIAGIALLPPKEAEAVAALNATTTFFDTDCCVHEAIAAQAARTPQQGAVLGQGQQLTYSELDERAAALAAALVRRGVRPGDIVGLCLERTPEMVVALLAILKAGAAYLPLDPAYPPGRIAFMIEDSAAPLVVTTCRIAATLGLPVGRTFLFDGPLAAGSMAELPAPMPENPAYLIYTSGSTGNPKGVVVTHRNVMNLFAGMADRIPHDPPGRWLAVTSLSFDISVLELFWTLAHGFTVVMHSDTVQDERAAPEFSLFYFATDNARDPKDRYKLLLEGAKFADREGFAAIWTPERHFHAFGGLYPNPAVTSAAIAAITTRLKIRAGSCVLPLHHPIRVAEEWAFVDNISQGRVGVSFASGWQPNDFVIAPQAFAERKAEMIRNVDVVRRLWRGEAVAFPGPQGKPVETRTLPRPVQPELPVWLTAAGNPETFQQAGEMGSHLLTHLLGQTLEDVAEKIKLYRAAWRRAGHAGHGHVTLMLHTFVGEDEDAVRETVRGPMKEYLRSSLDLIKQAAWSFPTFVQRGAEAGKTPVEIMDSRPLSPEEMDALLEHAFSRYYGTSALFGTPARCLALVGQLQQAGVDEIACLVDFGIDADTVLAHLGHLKQLMDAARAARPVQRRASIAGEIAEHAITHLQCTPSMASMLAADAAGRLALSQLSVLLVGGEALPLKLARELRSLVPDALLNVYGPTETTVWSTTCNLDSLGSFVPLGRAIANTQLSVRTPWGQECPALVPGELFIGGEGVTRGYWQRPALTAERFVADAAQPGARLYRTGDLVRRHPGGALEFLGRIDHQVKIRGHRIELGEIEAALLAQPGVAQAVVVAAGGEGDDTDGRLFAYVTPAQAAAPEPEQLRQALAERLPAVMVPQRVLVLREMPLTPNGKVDRRALPDPRAAIAVRSVAAPQSELERTIAAVWCDVLGVPAVGMTDNFFDLGGHSLLVVQVQRRLAEACGREVSITDMFRLPTVRALAAHLEGGESGTAVADGLDRARARRLMRARAGLEPTPTA